MRSFGDLIFQTTLVGLYGGRLGETKAQKMARLGKILVVLALLSAGAFAIKVSLFPGQPFVEPERIPDTRETTPRETEPEWGPGRSDF